METDLDKEFEMAKKAHMAETCYLYELINVREELEKSKGINIPMFLIKDKIEKEAQDRVLSNVASTDYNGLVAYYNKAYEVLAQIK